MPRRKKKQINKTAKGNRIEDMARNILENGGWLVAKSANGTLRKTREKGSWRVEKKPNVRFASKDFWGRFDFICLNHKEFRLVQVKADRAKPRDRALLADFPCPKNATKELWIYNTQIGQWLVEKIPSVKTTLA